MDFNVTVSLDEFESACKLIKKSVNGKKPFDLTMIFNGSTLRLVAGVTACEIPVNGTATAELILPGQIIRRLHGTFPNITSLHFSLSGSTFKIENLSLQCKIVKESVRDDLRKQALPESSSKKILKQKQNAL